MKIIYYSPHPHLYLNSASGFGTHMREMITAFENKGCEVLPVIMGGKDGPSEDKLEQSPTAKSFIKKILPNNIWRTLKDVDLLKFDYSAAKELEKAINEFNPDCIYERCNYLQLSGIKMAKKHDIYHIMELNTPYVDQNNFLSKGHSFIEGYARRIEKKQLQGTDLPLAVVGPLIDYFSKRHDINPQKFLVTHDAFNKNNIQLNAANQQKIKDEYKLHGKTVIGYIGSIFEWHGLDKLIKAFDEMDSENTKLLIVGYGEYMGNLIELAKSLGREGDIIFTGQVTKEEVFDYINIMDICTAPAAAWYQSPVKIFEYGAMGKPILGPDTAAVREVMEPDKDGILVKQTVEEVKEGMVKLICDPECGDKMGQHFQQKVLNDYTWDNNAAKVLEAVRNSEAHIGDN